MIIEDIFESFYSSLMLLNLKLYLLKGSLHRFLRLLIIIVKFVIGESFYNLTFSELIFKQIYTKS